MESSKKELKDLREKVSQLQVDLADREVEDARTHVKKHGDSYLALRVRKTHTLRVSAGELRDGSTTVE